MYCSVGPSCQLSSRSKPNFKEKCPPTLPSPVLPFLRFPHKALTAQECRLFRSGSPGHPQTSSSVPPTLPQKASLFADAGGCSPSQWELLLNRLKACSLTTCLQFFQFRKRRMSPSKAHLIWWLWSSFSKCGPRTTEPLGESVRMQVR